MRSFRAVRFAAICAVGLVGCVPPALTWHGTKGFDAFATTDTCRVTLFKTDEDGIARRERNRSYPAVERRGSEVLVGVVTVPIKLGERLVSTPTGDVQLRVDDLAPWTILAIESPSEVKDSSTNAATAGLPLVATMNLGAMMSARTMASGEKAAKILAQLKSGRTVMFRTSMMGNVSSEPIVFSLEGFNAAAAICGL